MSRLNVHRWGDPAQPSVLLLHGFMGSGRDWAPLVPYLKTDFHIIAPDMPGHGESLYLEDPNAYEFTSTAAMVMDIVDELALTNLALLGYSMGGRLALYLAVKFPERFSKLIVESATPGIDNDFEREHRRVKDATTAEYILDRDLNVFMETWYEQPLFGGLRDHPKYSDLLADRVMNDPAELALALRGMGQGAQPSLWQDLAGIDLPVLYMAGEQDEKYSGMLAEIANINPGIHTQVIAGAGHNIHFMQPEYYAECISKFIKQGR